MIIEGTSNCTFQHNSNTKTADKVNKAYSEKFSKLKFLILSRINHLHILIQIGQVTNTITEYNFTVAPFSHTQNKTTK